MYYVQGAFDPTRAADPADPDGARTCYPWHGKQHTFFADLCAGTWVLPTESNGS